MYVGFTANDHCLDLGIDLGAIDLVGADVECAAIGNVLVVHRDWVSKCRWSDLFHNHLVAALAKHSARGIAVWLVPRRHAQPYCLSNREAQPGLLGRQLGPADAIRRTQAAPPAAQRLPALHRRTRIHQPQGNTSPRPRPRPMS